MITKTLKLTIATDANKLDVIKDILSGEGDNQ